MAAVDFSEEDLVKRRRAARRAGVLVGLIAAAALAGCRAEEQGRQTDIEKGVYQGAADDPISDETKEALRLRAQKQNF